MAFFAQLAAVFQRLTRLPVASTAQLDVVVEKQICASKGGG
jgi:hypothetical protein